MDKSARTLIGLESPALSKEKPAGEEVAWPAASHLQITMVRGLCWHYKQLVAYEFTGEKIFFLRLLYAAIFFIYIELVWLLQ